LILMGISGVVFGAHLVFDSAVKIMKILDGAEKFIGLTIVESGTSLPELATSIDTALKKEMDISIGSLVVSNVFNIRSVIDYLSMIFISSLPSAL